MRNLISLVLMGLYLSAQSQALIPYLKDGLYGFADAKGKVIIAPQYEEVTKFGSSHLITSKSDKDLFDTYLPVHRPEIRLAHIRKDSLWYLIGTDGSKVGIGGSNLPIQVRSLDDCHNMYSQYTGDSLIHMPAVRLVNRSTGIWQIYNLQTDERGNNRYKYSNSMSFSRSSFGHKGRNESDYLIVDVVNPVSKYNSGSNSWCYPLYTKLGFGKQ